MIKLYDLLPKIYYDNSRDFQAIARSFEVLYNSIKTNADLINEEDITLVNLLASTLGFNVKHKYDSRDLYKICLVFHDIIKLKGSKSAILMAVNTLLNAQNIDAVPDVFTKNNVIEIHIPIELEDTILLEDLFDYILPAGSVYRFVYSGTANPATTKLTVDANTITTKNYTNENLSKIAKPVDRDEKAEDSKQDMSLTYTTQVYKPEGE